MNVKIRTVEKSMELDTKTGQRNVSSKRYSLRFGQSPWKRTPKEIFFTKPVNLNRRQVISLETSCLLVFFKYSHQIFLDGQCNFLKLTINITKTPQSDWINTKDQGRNQGSRRVRMTPLPLPFMCPFNLSWHCLLLENLKRRWSLFTRGAPLRCYNSNEVCHSLKDLTNFESNKPLNLSFLTK